ncbi:porin family protein [Pseudooceanicola sp. CBS1P-1]|uniref:Outer membrane beta-barrel protein n=1 Tax=Pseudooceanicola albus TaxID=2692189 RepID=A0A6L7G3M0_9RHOB|nr:MULTISPECIES: outer membrane beta-barrel protein [Pseudooceanicola]MBT9384898.1 porin family protein [Pseudooceanicola endophyticus]MXN18107.1 outer membrane beta-barrel protein [Pseudooceanicola albus]
MRANLWGLVLPLSGALAMLCCAGTAEAQRRWEGFYLGGNMALVFDADDYAKSLHMGLRAPWKGLLLGTELELSETDIGAPGGPIRNLDHVKLTLGGGSNQFLYYASGGLAVARGRFGAEAGAVLGVGIDYALSPHLSLGAEMQHHIFPDFNGSGRDPDINTLTARVTWTF